MKSIFESGEVMGYYAQIDYCYLMLGELAKEYSAPRSPITQMVDTATGYDKKRAFDATTNAINYLKVIIKCKKKIEADYSGDLEQLKQLKALTHESHPKT